MKKTFAKLQLVAATTVLALSPLLAMPTAHAGLLFDSAGKDQIDSAQSDIKEIGGATIVVCAMAWGIRKVRHI